MDRDDFVYDSDLEQSSIRSRPDNVALKDYWLGKKHFECMVARKILCQVGDDVTWISIDVCSAESLLTDGELNTVTRLTYAMKAKIRIRSPRL